MAFVDREIVCLDCSQNFVFTAGEQEFYERKGFKEEPKRCKPCRDNRKARRNDTPVAAGGHRPNGTSPGARPQSNGRPMSPPASDGGGFGFRGAADDDDDAQPFTRSAAAAEDGDEDNIGNRMDGPGPRRNGNTNGAARGASNGGGGGPRREMYDATCAQCGTATRVPFKPVPGRPVYCRDCYASRGATAARAR